MNENGAIVPAAGAVGSFVGNGTIPTGAAGVKVSSGRNFKTYFLGLMGVGSWDATASATATGGYAAGGPGTGGTLFPAGISLSFFTTFPFCSGPVSTVPTDACYPHQLTPGNLNVPGGFGWLKFGCDGYGLDRIRPERRWVLELQAVPAERDRAAKQQLRLLHPGRHLRPRSDRQPARQQGQR